MSAIAIALDPLIAEAKRRARRRRWLAVVALAAAGVAAAVISTDFSETPRTVPLGAPTCRASALRLTTSFMGVAAGTDVERLAFTNTSSSTCTLDGRPSFWLVLSSRRSIAIRPQPYPALFAARLVVLQPGGAARAYLFDSTGGYQRPCAARLRSLLVVPPGRSAPLRQAVRVTYCGTRSLSTTALAQGLGGRHAF